MARRPSTPPDCVGGIVFTHPWHYRAHPHPYAPASNPSLP